MLQFFKKNTREMSVVVAIVVMFIFFGIADPIYVSANNVRDIIEQATIYGLMGIGITGIIITGAIDLSIGSALALVGVLVAKMAVNSVAPLFCLLLGLVFGLLFGIINGLLVTKLKLQPFIATMGTMSVYRGFAYVFTKGYPILNIPLSYRRFIDGELFPFVRISVLIFFLFAFIMYIVLSKTRLGIHIYAIGGNIEATRLSGVRVEFNQTVIYALGMCGTALAAMVQVGKLGTGDPTTGNGWELNAIAATAIGGTSMAGGRGSIFGTVLGAILFAGLRVGLIVLGVDTFYQFIATGLVIILAAAIEVMQTNISIKTKKNKDM
jgi:ribose transport system permease protein